MIRVICCNMYPMILNGLVDILRSATDIEVVATSLNGSETLARIRTLDPDIVLFALRGDDSGAHDLARRIAGEHLRTRVITLGVDLTDDQAVAALRIGVHGILDYEMTEDEILTCVRSVHTGHTWVAPALARQTLALIIRQDMVSAGLEQLLTPQELAVTRLVIIGHSNKQIAAELGVALGTVKAHLNHIYGKLEVENRVELLLRTQEDDFGQL